MKSVLKTILTTSMILSINGLWSQSSHVKDSYPSLYYFSSFNFELIELLDVYTGLLLDTASIQSQEDVMALVSLRDSMLIPMIDDQLFLINEDTIYPYMEHLEEELASLHILMITAEGMYTGLGPLPMLDEKVEKFCSEDYALFLQFNTATAFSMGGEYPYYDMQPYIDMVLIGERLQNQFSESIYTKRIERDFNIALQSLFDVHAVKMEFETPHFVFGTSYEYWPYGTDMEARAAFADSNVNSIYPAMMRSVLDNISALDIDKEDFYIIVTDWSDTYAAAQQKIIAYLQSGYDVPHLLTFIDENETESFAVAYRFHPYKSFIDPLFEKIKDTFPEVEIVWANGWAGWALSKID